MHGFVGGVAGIQIGKDEYRGLPCDWTMGRFLLADRLDTGRIVLQRAVNNNVRALFAHKLGGAAHFDHFCALAGLTRGVGNHGYARRYTERRRRIGGLNGNVGQLFGIRVRINRAIAIHQHLIGHQHKEHAGDQLGSRCGFNQLQGRADGICRGMNRAGHKAVHIVLIEHHGAERHVVFQLLFGHGRTQPFVLAQFDHRRDIARTHALRLNDFDAFGQAHAMRFGDLQNLVALSKKHAAGNAFFRTHRRRLNGTRLVAFG